MIKTFINDDGGFYNRVTESMKIAPFNLAETKLYLESKDIHYDSCLLYTSDAADERSSVDLGGRRIIKKKKHKRTGVLLIVIH